MMDAIFVWVEKVMNGRIVQKEQQGRWRRQWFLIVENASGKRFQVMLRGSRAPGVMGDEPRTRAILRFEAAVLRALQDTPVLVPRYYGYHEQEDWILMEQLPGTPEVVSLSDPVKSRGVFRHYIENLAALHLLEYKTLDLPKEMQVPGAKDELVLGTLVQREMRYRGYRLARPEPLIDFGLWWLHSHVPEGRDEVRLLQGDTGPYQFMFDGDRVTGLIDWELARLGDPLEDLGCMRMRSILYHMDDVGDHIQYYGEVTGRPIDWDVIRFYTTTWLIQTPMAFCDKTQKPDIRVPESLAIFAWDAVMRRGLCESLMEVMGIKSERPAVPSECETPRSVLHEFLLERMDRIHLPKAVDPFDAFQTAATRDLTATLAVGDRLGPAMDRTDLDQMAEVLGKRPKDRDEGLVSLSKLVCEDPEGNAEKLLPLFYGMQVRREAIFEPIIRGADVAYGVPLQPLNKRE